jgi:VCBS repeat protein
MSHRWMGITAIAAIATLVLSSETSIQAAVAGLPYLEDFDSASHQSASETTARWSTEEAELTLAFSQRRFGAFGTGNTTGIDISDEFFWTMDVALGDVDGDGDLDLLLGTGVTYLNFLFLNNGTANPFSGVTGTKITNDTFNTNSWALGDVDGDGDLDLVAGYGNTNEINRLYLNDGVGDPWDTVTGVDITTDAHTTNSIALGDIDGDGDLDLVVGNENQFNRLYLNNGTSTPFGGVTGSNIGTDTDGTRSIALGDIDGDGDLDLVAGNDNQVNGLYLNNGTSSPFSGVVSSEITADSDDTRAVVLGDVDGDGDLDFIAGNNALGGPNRLYLNDGAGDPWDTISGIDIAPADWQSTTSVALGDVDADGDLDFISGSYMGGTPDGRNRLYLNNGTANPFEGVGGTDITADRYQTRSVALGDVDGDGDLDLIAGSYQGSSGPTRLYLNNATANPWNGVSGSDVTSDTHQTRAVTIGDVDSDGDLDFIAGNVGINRLYLNSGTDDPWSGGGIDIRADIEETYSLALGDVDGDGDLDLVAGNRVGVQQNKRYLNDGIGDPWDSGGGAEITDDTYQTLCVLLGDVDNDGDLDFISGNNGANTLYLNDGTADPWGSVVTGTVLPGLSTGTEGLALGDVDRDGDLDLVVGNAGSVNQLLLNNGTSNPWNGVTATDITSDANDTRGVALGDVDSDGDLDLVVGNATAQRNRLYLNNGTASPFSGVTGSDITADEEDTFDAELWDVDGDGDLDLLVPNTGAGESNHVYLNDGDGDPWDTGLRFDISADTDTTNELAIGDVDGDGDLDVVTGNNGQTNCLYLNSFTASGETGAHPFNLNTVVQETLPGAAATHSMALADMDGDGDLDLIEADRIGAAPRLTLNNGTESPWEGQTTTAIGSDTYRTTGVAIGDVDSDGDLDLITANEGGFSGIGGADHPNRLFLNNGTADPFSGVSGSNIGSTNCSTMKVALGDIDNDGDLDLVTAERDNTQRNHCYLNSGTADPFSPEVVSDIGTAEEYTSDIALADFNSDGLLDVVVVTGQLVSSGPTRVHLNDGSASPFSSGTPITIESANSYSVDVGDVDGDGDIDIANAVFGNTGNPNRVHLNDGTGAGWTSSNAGSDAVHTNAVKLCDVDCDGDLDLLAIQQHTPADLRLYLNDGTDNPWNGLVGIVIDPSFGGTGSNNRGGALTSGDVNGDGIPEIIAGLFINAGGANDSALANRMYSTADLFQPHRGLATSLSVDSETGNIPSVLPNIEADLPPNTDVDLWVSNTGGTRWSLVEPGQDFLFPSLGSDLRWRVEMSSLSPAASPRVENLRLADSSVAYPTLVDVQLLETPPINGLGAPGESIVLEFDRAIDVPSTVTVSAADFYLTSGSLGTDTSLAASPKSNTQAVLTFGSTISGIAAGTTAIDIGASFTSGRIVDALTGNDAEDGGVVDTDDTALPIQAAVQTATTAIDLTLGGRATVNTSGAFVFTRHALAIPAGALPGTSVNVTMGPVSDGIRSDLALPSTVAITTSQGEGISFASPVTLEMQFDPQAHDLRVGFQDYRFQIVQIVEVSPGVFDTTHVPGDQTTDLVENTIGVEISNLDPVSGGVPGVFATLPVEPINERTSHILLGGAGGSAVVRWDIGDPGEITPDTGSEYFQHSVEFPGYEEVAEGTPGSFNVTMRAATLYERVSISTGQSFPNQGAAIFVVETTDAGGSPVPFTDPVNITVQFIDRSHNASTDLVDYSADLGPANLMRLTRDTAPGLPVDFQTLPRIHTVDESLGTVTVDGVIGLTNSDGKGVWGGVIDVIPVELSVFRAD